MSIAISIQASDGITPVTRRVANAIQPARLNPVIGRSVNNTVREHLFSLNSARPNKLGGRRTNFYTGAARGTQFKVVSDSEIVLSINQVGIAQRYYGGTIKPKSSKFLTIPVHPAAHGKRAREFDLEVVFGVNGQPVALATKKVSESRTRQSKSGKITRTNVTRFGEIYYRLVRSVTQAADPNVLPKTEVIGLFAQRDVNAVVNRAIAGAGGATS
jgi:hypothetical protein